jgi:hypothetical protein
VQVLLSLPLCRHMGQVLVHPLRLDALPVHHAAPAPPDWRRRPLARITCTPDTSGRPTRLPARTALPPHAPLHTLVHTACSNILVTSFSHRLFTPPVHSSRRRRASKAASPPPRTTSSTSTPMSTATSTTRSYSLHSTPRRKRRRVGPSRSPSSKQSRPPPRPRPNSARVSCLAPGRARWARSPAVSRSPPTR